MSKHTTHPSSPSIAARAFLKAVMHECKGDTELAQQILDDCAKDGTEFARLKAEMQAPSSLTFSEVARVAARILAPDAHPRDQGSKSGLQLTPSDDDEDKPVTSTRNKKNSEADREPPPADDDGAADDDEEDSESSASSLHGFTTMKTRKRNTRKSINLDAPTNTTTSTVRTSTASSTNAPTTTTTTTTPTAAFRRATSSPSDGEPDADDVTSHSSAGTTDNLYANERVLFPHALAHAAHHQYPISPDDFRHLLPDILTSWEDQGREPVSALEMPAYALHHLLNCPIEVVTETSRKRTDPRLAPNDAGSAESFRFTAPTLHDLLVNWCHADTHILSKNMSRAQWDSVRHYTPILRDLLIAFSYMAAATQAIDEEDASLTTAHGLEHLARAIARVQVHIVTPLMPEGMSAARLKELEPPSRFQQAAIVDKLHSAREALVQREVAHRTQQATFSQLVSIEQKARGLVPDTATAGKASQSATKPGTARPNKPTNKSKQPQQQQRPPQPRQPQQATEDEKSKTKNTEAPKDTDTKEHTATSAATKATYAAASAARQTAQPPPS